MRIAGSFVRGAGSRAAEWPRLSGQLPPEQCRDRRTAAWPPLQFTCCGLAWFPGTCPSMANPSRPSQGRVRAQVASSPAFASCPRTGRRWRRDPVSAGLLDSAWSGHCSPGAGDVWPGFPSPSLPPPRCGAQTSQLQATRWPPSSHFSCGARKKSQPVRRGQPGSPPGTLWA